MRRPSPEWLLAPVFALPLAAAGALVLWARHDYLARTDPMRADGATLARRRLVAQSRDFALLTQSFTQELPRPTVADDGWVAFRHPAVSGFVRVTAARAPQRPWLIAADFPGGLRPTALADAGVRLAIETGLAPAQHDGADAGTTAFREFVEAPDAERIRNAPLPASTKVYLLRRAAADRSTEDITTLTALDALSRLVAEHRGKLTPGAHYEGDTVVLVPAGDGPTLVFARAADLPFISDLLVMDWDGDDDACLTWAVRRDFRATGDEVVWHERLDAPFAGDWSWVVRHGGRWWQSSANLWVFPAVLGCLAFLFVPTALLIAIRRRRKLDESRARFVNELAHDLRTPVTSLRLHAEMLSEGRVPVGEEKRYLDVLGRETARLSALLANLLDLSRVERGAREYELRPVDVAEVVDETTRDFALLHPKRAADVTVDVADGLAATADRTALVRCVANLLDNAGKFTKPGTPVRVTAARADDARVRIVVADEGDGVAPSERSRVFELYERGAAAKNGAPGTGLGLALVRELVEGMHGRVALVDSPRGATFEIVLPEARHG